MTFGALTKRKKPSLFSLLYLSVPYPLSPRNLDPLTETYHLGFYLTYLARWPEYMTTAVSSNGDVMGYGKTRTPTACDSSALHSPFPLLPYERLV